LSVSQALRQKTAYTFFKKKIFLWALSFCEYRSATRRLYAFSLHFKRMHKNRLHCGAQIFFLRIIFRVKRAYIHFTFQMQASKSACIWKCPHTQEACENSSCLRLLKTQGGGAWRNSDALPKYMEQLRKRVVWGSTTRTHTRR
jgi:hypothetical protein